MREPVRTPRAASASQSLLTRSSTSAKVRDRPSTVVKQATPGKRSAEWVRIWPIGHEQSTGSPGGERSERSGRAHSGDAEAGDRYVEVVERRPEDPGEGRALVEHHVVVGTGDRVLGHRPA